MVRHCSLHELGAFFLRDYRVLSVKSMFDSLFIVYLIYDPVGIFLYTCCEYNHFVIFAKLSKKFHTERSHQKIRIRSIINQVTQGLIKIEHQTILTLIFFFRWQEWSFLSLQLMIERTWSHLCFILFFFIQLLR